MTQEVYFQSQSFYTAFLLFALYLHLVSSLMNHIPVKHMLLRRSRMGRHTMLCVSLSLGLGYNGGV